MGLLSKITVSRTKIFSLAPVKITENYYFKNLLVFFFFKIYSKDRKLYVFVTVYTKQRIAASSQPLTKAHWTSKAPNSCSWNSFPSIFFSNTHPEHLIYTCYSLSDSKHSLENCKEIWPKALPRSAPTMPCSQGTGLWLETSLLNHIHPSLGPIAFILITIQIMLAFFLYFKRVTVEITKTSFLRLDKYISDGSDFSHYPSYHRFQFEYTHL